VFTSKGFEAIHNSCDIFLSSVTRYLRRSVVSKSDGLWRARLLFWLLTRYRPHKRFIREVSCSCYFDSRHKRIHWAQQYICHAFWEGNQRATLWTNLELYPMLISSMQLSRRELTNNTLFSTLVQTLSLQVGET